MNKLILTKDIHINVEEEECWCKHDKGSFCWFIHVKRMEKQMFNSKM